MPGPRPVSLVLAVALAASPTLAPSPRAGAEPRRAVERDPDAVDQGDFWGSLIAPHATEIATLVEAGRALLDQRGAARADRRVHAHRLREANTIAARVRALDPRAPGLDYLLGAIADEAGRAATAEAHLRTFVEGAPAGAQRTDALLRLGRIALVRREPHAAIRPLRRALAEQRARPERTRALLLLASALDEAGDLDAAIALLAGAIDRHQGPGESEDNAVWLALAAAYDRDDQVSASLDVIDRLRTALGADYLVRLTPMLDEYAPAPVAAACYLRALVYETGELYGPARLAWTTYLGLGAAARHRPRAQAHVDALDGLLAARRAPAAPARRVAAPPRRAPRRQP